MADDRKVIVVGGGLSGLSAAKLLHEAGTDVLVLEASDRIGGRLYSVKNDRCGYVDLGGSYVGPTQNRILRLAKEFNVKTYAINEDQDLLQYINGEQRRFSGGLFPPFKSHIGMLDINHLLRSMDEYGKKIPLDAPWDAPEAEKWDNMTLQQWYDKMIWTDEVMDHAKRFARINLSAEPYEMSLLWSLWYIRGAGGTVRIDTTDNGAQERKFIGGSQQIPLNIARQLGIGTSVKTESPVQKITQTEDNVIVTTADGSQFEADQVILAMSPIMQLKMTFEPPLPPQRNQLIQRVPMGSIIKTMIYYDRQFWRDKGFCGTTFIDTDDMDLLLVGSMNDTKPDGSFPCLIGFVAGDKARHYAKFTKEQRKRKVAECYAKVFQTDEALKPVHYEEKDWCSDPWIGGCYTGFMPPGALTKFGRALRAPYGRLYFAGTETATHWPGYMEGAVQAGERAAREVLHVQGKLSKEKIWQREPESEDFPARPIETTFMERNLPSVQNYYRMLGLLGTSAIAAIAGYLFKKSKL